MIMKRYLLYFEIILLIIMSLYLAKSYYSLRRELIKTNKKINEFYPKDLLRQVILYSTIIIVSIYLIFSASVIDIKIVSLGLIISALYSLKMKIDYRL